MSNKSNREIELELELAKTRMQLVSLSIWRMQHDYNSLEDEIVNLTKEINAINDENNTDG
ncbi:hypothetical protein [Pluralibacter gergoviae]|uniref:hypothetical protein n=1 Tax=Pluralibacter gergoviae TaxID=61647 RepID=UPI001248F64B|nr:hypothetical protein [Pluralibacter gergoviae]